MSRNYSTHETMLVDPFDRVVTPDAHLINTLHRLLDMIPDDNHALIIDKTVAELLRFHNPQYQRHLEIINPNKEQP